jgi:small subunit ribosomal protein S6
MRTKTAVTEASAMAVAKEDRREVKKDVTEEAPTPATAVEATTEEATTEEAAGEE